LFATLSLIVLPTGHRVVALLLALVFLMLTIVFGILSRQWILVSFVVSPIVATVVLVSVPSLLRPRRYAQDSAAIANLRTINTAEVTYQSSSRGGYGTMTDLIAAGLLDDTFTFTKGGYIYSITVDATGSAYTAEAVPASTRTGRYGYYTLPDAVVRYSTTASLAPKGQSGRYVQ
jgi:competence protein ComGC